MTRQPASRRGCASGDAAALGSYGYDIIAYNVMTLQFSVLVYANIVSACVRVSTNTTPWRRGPWATKPPSI